MKKLSVAPRVASRATTGWTLADTALGGVIITAAVAYVSLVQRGAEFYSGDTSYDELARSLLRHSYGFDFRAETMLPPGFPAMMALVAAVFGDTHVAMVRMTALCAALAIGAAYFLLRREAGRPFAATITLMLLASPTIFGLSTESAMSDLPYLVTSMTGLLLALILDRAERASTRLWLAVGCGTSLVVSLLIRSAGIALFTGLAAWLGVSLAGDRATAIRRWRTFLPILLAGCLVQGAWTSWISRHNAPAEWPIGGYPQAYTSQFWVRNGNEPELGRARISDLPLRAAQNLVARAGGIIEVATGKSGRLPHGWFVPWICGAVLLIVVGLAQSLKRGGAVHDWYFIAHETMYLLWPWDLEMRFIVPIVPLACLYAWRGARTVAAFSARAPRVASAAGLLLTAVGLGAAAHQLARGVSMRALTPTIAWIGIAAVLFGLAWQPDAWRVLFRYRRRLRASVRIPIGPVTLASAIIALNAPALIQIARENVAFAVTRADNYAEICAAQWIRGHTPPNVVVMARQMDVVYHYADRRVVWFPPMTDPHELYAGVVKHHVSLVLVFNRGHSYWRPPESDGFKRLVEAYPGAFRLIEQNGDAQIYAVTLRPEKEMLDDSEM